MINLPKKAVIKSPAKKPEPVKKPPSPKIEQIVETKVSEVNANQAITGIVITNID